MPSGFPKQLYSFTLPLALCQSPACPASLPPRDGRGGVSPRLWLTLPSRRCRGALPWVLTVHSDNFLKSSAWSSLFLNLFLLDYLSFSLLICGKFLYILCTSPLSERYITNISFLSSALPFIFFVGPLDEHTFLMMMKFGFSSVFPVAFRPETSACLRGAGVPPMRFWKL